MSACCIPDRQCAGLYIGSKLSEIKEEAGHSSAPTQFQHLN